MPAKDTNRWRADQRDPALDGESTARLKNETAHANEKHEGSIFEQIRTTMSKIKL
jgi:hypothetical protein